MRRLKPAAHLQRFASVYGIVQNLFRAGPHLLRSAHYRQLRTRASSRTFGEYFLGVSMDSILLRNSWVHKFACFEVNEAQAESLCAVTEVAERPGAMLGLIGLDSRIGVVDVTS